jgi:hypothetical protein
MNINHEKAVGRIWKAKRYSWRQKIDRLHGMWDLVLYSLAETDRELEERKQAMDDIELLIDIAMEHQFTDTALAA